MYNYVYIIMFFQDLAYRRVFIKKSTNIHDTSSESINNDIFVKSSTDL